MIAVIIIGVFGRYFAPYSPTEFVGAPFTPPSSGHIFGTDTLGRDTLTRVLWGGRDILWMSVAAALLGTGLGALLGLIAGYVPRLDNLLMRPLEVIQGFPILVLVLVFISMLGPKQWLIVLLVAIAWIPGVARVARGMTMDIATREYVTGAEIIGIPRLRILRLEVLPNVFTPLMVELGLRLTWSIAAIAAISFLGAGPQPPSTDWGLMINENRNGLGVNPWPVIVPSVLVALFAIGSNFVTEGVARTVARVDRVGSEGKGKS